MNIIKVILSLLKKKKIYITPACPVCKTESTDRVVYGMGPNATYWVIDNAKRKSESAYYIQGIREVNSPNCHCPNCGALFNGYIKEEYLTRAEIKKRRDPDYKPMSERQFKKKIKMDIQTKKHNEKKQRRKEKRNKNRESLFPK